MRALFGLIFAASGAAALIYEVTWTRLLTLQLGHGVAAASTVLAAFMGGLAVGSAVGGKYATRLTATRALQTYAVLEILIAILAVILPLELAALDPLLGAAYADGRGGATFAVLRFVTSLLLLSVPAAAMGATFPVASRWFVTARCRRALCGKYHWRRHRCSRRRVSPPPFSRPLRRNHGCGDVEPARSCRRLRRLATSGASDDDGRRASAR
jgi:hypothetical protein